MQFDLVYQIVTVIAVVIGSSVALFKMYYWYQDRKPTFTYERFEQIGGWKIRILHPSKSITKISVLRNGKPTPLSDVPHLHERSMREGEGQNFDLDKDMKDEDKIEIKFDKYKIKKRFKDIPMAKNGY